MATSLRLVFWGLVLVFADLRLAGLDALPDAAGYAMAAVGAGRLAATAPGFRAARLAAWAMVLPGMVDAVVPLQGALLPGIIEALGQAALEWALLSGIATWTAEGGRPDLAGRARHLRAASLALLAVALPLGFAARGGGGLGVSDAAGLGVVLAVLTFVLLAMVLHLVHRVRMELTPEAARAHVPGPAAYPPRG